MSPGTYHLSRLTPVAAWTACGCVWCPACAAARWDSDALAKDRVEIQHEEDLHQELVRPLFAGEGDPEVLPCDRCGRALRLGGDL